MFDMKKMDVMKAGDILLEFLLPRDAEPTPEITAELKRHVDMGYTNFGYSRLDQVVQYLFIPTYALPLREVKNSTIQICGGQML